MLLLLTAFISLSTAAIAWISIQIYAWFLRRTNVFRRRALLDQLGLPTGRRRIIGFFHPYCNAGGGGERVLWTAIAAIQRNESDIVSVVYSGDIDVTKEQILDKVKARFDILLEPSKIHFVFLRSRKWIEDAQWPHFTLLGQSLGSIYLAWEAMSCLIPDLYIDTMGYAFTFQIASILGRIPVGAYVHYPTISTDMLSRVRSRKKWHTNAAAISSSVILSRIKLLYYRFFMYHYASSLRTALFLMVNSSWTKNHVDAILQHHDVVLDALYLFPPISVFSLLNTIFSSGKGGKDTVPRIVYPPCDTREMSNFPLDNREPVILSVAQFRPEKDHPAQLRAFGQLLKAHPEYRKQKGSQGFVRLVLIGGSRNDEDARRVTELRRLAQELGVEEQVEIIVNAPYSVVLYWLSKASIGLSTMVDEHFGINIVEFMAAGVIPVTHASGGPLKDIVIPFNGKPTGYHAESIKDFVDALYDALSLPPEDELALRHRARTWANQRFSEEEFEKGWNASRWKEWLLR